MATAKIEVIRKKDEGIKFGVLKVGEFFFMSADCPGELLVKTSMDSDTGDINAFSFRLNLEQEIKQTTMVFSVKDVKITVTVE
jgi:hypothetical protein